MSQAIGILDKTFESAEDLSTKQYYAVYLSAAQKVSLCTTDHLNAIGVLQNDPHIGEAASVRVAGTTKAVASDSITAGTRVVATADGKIAPITTASATEQEVIGIALEDASADGEIIEILLTHESYVKGSSS